MTQRCDEYNEQIQEIQQRIIDLSEKIDIIKEDNEILIVFVRSTSLSKASKSKYSVSIAQPYNSSKPEEISATEDKEINPTMIIDSTQYPPVIKSTPKNKEGAKKFEFPGVRRSFGNNQQTAASSTGYQEKFLSATKPNTEGLGGTIAMKISQTPKVQNKKFEFTQTGAVPSTKHSGFSTAKRSRIGSSAFSNNQSMENNEYVMLYNTKQKLPQRKTSLRWREAFVLKYHPNAEDRAKGFTITLVEHQKSESRIVGSERTFKLDQFDPNKIYDLNIELKQNFKKATEAQISVKLQYIKNYKKALTLALENLKTEKKKYYALLRSTLDRIKYLKENPEMVDITQQNGGWYEATSPSIRKSPTMPNEEEETKKTKTFIDVSMNEASY